MTMGWGILGWGANDGGQLGASGGSSTPVEVVALGTGLDAGMFKAVSGGYRHSLALTDGGAVWAWGDNSLGQLGDNLASIGGKSGIHWSDVFGPDIAPVYSPVRVAGPGGHGFLKDVVEIAAGGNHCVARLADNTVWAWGSNRFGQLGDGTRDNRWVPVQVQLPWNAIITAIAAGYRHSLAVVEWSEKGPTFRQFCDVWACGENYFGQLGDGSTQDRQVPVPVRTARRGESETEVWLEIAAGGAHSLARREDGTLWAWGCNDRGQLGDGTTKTSHLPVQVRGLPPPNREILQIAAGHQHSLAIVASPGSVWAWGSNRYGQLGDGTMGKLNPKDDVRSEPVKVVGADLDNVVTVRAGWLHSLALCGNGTLWAWGDNFFRQLGNGGTTGARCTPSKVLVAGSAWAAIAAGAFHNLLAAK
jgi:alpha-tubulin suppressor-like RCC1 family protein